MECKRYTSAAQLPEHAQSHWRNREQLFSKYNDGIRMTENAWYEVTPEPIARKIAEQLTEAAPEERRILIDVFGGVGGNAIAFALTDRWDQIFVIERDAEALACAKENARIYGVENRIWWIQGDCFEVIRTQLASVASRAVVFASPPWGGPSYRLEDVFDLETMVPYSLSQLHAAFAQPAGHVVFYLPRTSNLRQLAAYVPDGKQLHVKHYCIMGLCKALCAYYGDFKFDE